MQSSSPTPPSEPSEWPEPAVQPATIPVAGTMPEPVAQPQPVTPIEVVAAVEPKKAIPQRHYLAAFFISFMWGTFGADRFYMGYKGLAVLKLLTVGGVGIWSMVDFIFISTGFMKDKQGRDMLQVEEYKRFANRVVFWFSVIAGAVVLIGGVALIWSAAQLFNAFQGGGGLNTLLQGSGFSPSSLGL